MKFQQIIFALIRIIQILISLKFTLLNIIPKSLVTLQFLKFLIFQIKAYIQGFQMRYQSFLGHRYPNSYSWFSDSVDIPFVLITTVRYDWKKFKMLQRVQFKDVSLNPFKTVRSLGSGMRMIYDANMEAIMRESMCQKWFQISC